MSDQKSYAEFILGTLDALLVDCASQYPELAKEFRRDSLRLSSAVNCHGIRFALDTMPAYRKHFDQCLAKRRLSPSGLLHFGVLKKDGTIPRLFRGLVLRVFDHNGSLRLDADVNAIRWIRQLLGAVRKLKMASSLKDTGKVIQEFINIDSEVKLGSLDWESQASFACDNSLLHVSFTDANVSDVSRNQGELFPPLSSDPTPSYGLLQKVQQVADYICSKLGYFNPTEWRPKHGPGAVADQGFGSYKYDFKVWPSRLESVFPYADFAHANFALANPLVGKHTPVLSKEVPARLCAVPKTLSTPRLIAAEPTSLQWCQQTIRDYMYTRVSKTTIRDFVDFRRQDLNGALALQASRVQSHSTIDLSSASDRISCWHVERLFRRSPSLLRALQATRSVWIEQKICRVAPRYHYLRKYSTMGNATTFPVQTLFFLSLALGAVLYARNLRVSDRVIGRLGKEEVRVFGDDIIVPKDSSGLLLELLQALGLRVNQHKTFTEGDFRESCGVDAYGGNNVTTINILEVPKRASPGSIVSSVDVHNNLTEVGYAHTARWVRKTVQQTASYLKKIRFVGHGSGLFGWSSLLGEEDVRLESRHNQHLHRGEVRCLRLRVQESHTPAKESAGLLQYFTEAPEEVSSAYSTLGHLARRPRVGLTLGWVPVV